MLLACADAIEPLGKGYSNFASDFNGFLGTAEVDGIEESEFSDANEGAENLHQSPQLSNRPIITATQTRRSCTLLRSLKPQLMNLLLTHTQHLKPPTNVGISETVSKAPRYDGKSSWKLRFKR